MIIGLNSHERQHKSPLSEGELLKVDAARRSGYRQERRMKESMRQALLNGAHLETGPAEQNVDDGVPALDENSYRDIVVKVNS